jgi:hypothetical protein
MTDAIAARKKELVLAKQAEYGYTMIQVVQHYIESKKACNA